MMSQITEIVHDIKGIACLSILNDSELMHIGRQAETRSFARNALIFSETQSVQYFFTVRTGSVKLFKTSKEGRELIIRTMHPGDHFCCASIYGGEGHFVSAIALSDTVLTTIPTEKFKAMLEGAGGMSLKIIKGLCSRVNALSSLLEDVTFHDVDQRVMKTLLRLADEKDPEKNLVMLALKHQEIAAMTGTVREVISRTMSRLKKAGVVSNSSSRGFIIDKDKLFLQINKISG